MLLRKKKYQEKLLGTTDAQLENLEKLAADLEFAQVELQVLDGLKAGNVALKKVHDILTIDEIERVLDETKEGIDKQQEIDEALSGALTQQDEDDVMAELDELIETEATGDKNIVDADEDLSDRLPEVPMDDLPEKRRKANKGEKRCFLFYFAISLLFSLLQMCLKNQLLWKHNSSSTIFKICMYIN